MNKPVVLQSIAVPAAYLSLGPDGPYGGDIRVGDLTGNGRPDLLVYRSLDDAHDGGGMKPCFLGAFTLEGRPIWAQGSGGVQPSRPGPVAIHDLDGDGCCEVVCLFRDERLEAAPTSMANVVVQLRDGATGEIKREAAPDLLRACCGRGPNWVHQRILIANLRGLPTPRDFIIKLGPRVIAFDDNLDVLWSYLCPWTEYGQCPAYIPAIGDIDGDGHDEVNGGYFLLDHNGVVLWERQLGPNMDSVAIEAWDAGHMRALCSGHGHVVDGAGRIILALGEAIVPHGQELRVGHFDPAVAGPQMMIRYMGHTPDMALAGQDGQVIRRFRINQSPNNTGMEIVYWNGFDAPPLLYNGGTLWTGTGERVADLPDLPAPFGDFHQGWYHAIPIDLCDTAGEELLVYNPWDRSLYLFAHPDARLDRLKPYTPTPRQYNARLMD